MVVEGRRNEEERGSERVGMPRGEGNGGGKRGGGGGGG